ALETLALALALGLARSRPFARARSRALESFDFLVLGARGLWFIYRSKNSADAAQWEPEDASDRAPTTTRQDESAVARHWPGGWSW
uniref:Uncharacterized protein n=1 Tax=Cyclopterus lumpus TaxID=8103 RepID=A0A8C2WRH2_CYCLU